MKRNVLKRAREEKGYGQLFIAQNVGIHRSYYGFIENGKRNPTYEVALKISNVLGKDIKELFKDEIFFNKKCYKV